jgi:hypothetical protein
MHRLTVVVLVLALAGSAAAEEKALTGLKVLVVSPEAGKEGAAGIGKLLTSHGAAVTAVAWKDAGLAKARAFDLVVVTGPDRLVGKDAVWGYEVPVLGLGPYGYVYFGRDRLKHGSPHS